MTASPYAPTVINALTVSAKKNGILDLHSLQIRPPRLKHRPIMLHDIDADRRTQVRLVMIPVDFGDQVIDRFSALLRDVGERVPHDGFKSEAGSMIAKEDSAGCRDTFGAFISCPHGR
jgi:hypothetical protein